MPRHNIGVIRHISSNSDSDLRHVRLNRSLNRRLMRHVRLNRSLNRRLNRRRVAHGLPVFELRENGRANNPTKNPTNSEKIVTLPLP